MTAKIRWMDTLRGEGMIRLADGTSIGVHFTELTDTFGNNYHYPNDLTQHILEVHYSQDTPVQYIADVGWRDLGYMPCDPRDSD